ncbi:somatomedin-B and thrombospondin type-1 domain-containing protein isoform X1 [Pristis pectinata]|uniref:somatomedin-B and thrombospondin type-1 domain-containing protein isoform X1 n=1 Tax=Pristis pectinata TaxID=685728 RepID=UPI00223CE821|nr:somatomedin-B and thrombospondin type-1 domain-containing protein isoform X1 [Pristis pectinata]
MELRAVLSALGLGFVLFGAGAEGGCVDFGTCCKGRESQCHTTGWRPDRSYGTCYCDQACGRTLDCCHDYQLACPAVSCKVTEWSFWSGCAEPCKNTYRVRRRYIVQEPKNGGELCPPLEERAGCVEYRNDGDRMCRQSLVPALITTGGYGKARRKRDASIGSQEPGYCVEFQVKSLTQNCLIENRPHARWMQYLRPGFTVCVECQPPALNSGFQRCYGDGGETESRNQILQWYAVGNPHCRGTWKWIRQMESCSCPLVHSFLFI